MNTITKKIIFGGIALIPLMTGCSKDPGISADNTENMPLNPEIEAAFNFKMTADIPVSLNYPTFAYVQIYDKLPDEKNDAKVIFNTYTGANGKFSGMVHIATAYIGKKVYAIANGIGCPTVTEAEVTPKGLVINAAASRATIDSESPYNTNVLNNIKAGVLNALPEGGNNNETVKDLYTMGNIDITVQEETESIDVTFITAVGYNDNSLYYYVYKEGEDVNPRDFINDENYMKYWIFGPYNSFPENTDPDKDANSHGGTTKRLVKYTADGETTKFQAGDKIGFILVSRGYEYPFETNYFFTRTVDYPDGYSQAARYRYNEEALVYTFEDEPLYSNINGVWISKGGKDFNDFIFLVKSTPEKAIVEDETPELPEPPFYLSEYQNIEGTLLFEDFYPSQGDYDMNDAVYTYKLTGETKVHYNPETETKTPPYYLSSVEYSITPIWDGAHYGSKFGFSLGEKEVFDLCPRASDTYMGKITAEPATGKLDYGFTVNTNDNGEETYIKGGIELTEEKPWSSLFDPFITVDETGYEVHTSKGKPSSKAKTDGLDEWALNYLYKDSKFPYAMDIPILEYQIVKERTRIDKFYPQYLEWVESGGESNTDWYNYPTN